MPSLTEKAVLIADDVRLDFLEEAREELTGESRKRWALVAVAFVLGVAVATVVIALNLRRAGETLRDADADADAAAGPAPSSD